MADVFVTVTPSGDVTVAAPVAGVTVTAATGGITVASAGGVTDHGALTGTDDDDHPQYALVVFGTRPTDPRPGTIYVP